LVGVFVGQGLGCGQNGNFHLECIQFGRCHRLETVIVKGRVDGLPPNAVDKGLHPGQAADAAAQRVAFMQSHENTLDALQCLLAQFLVGNGSRRLDPQMAFDLLPRPANENLSLHRSEHSLSGFRGFHHQRGSTLLYRPLLSTQL